MNNTPEIDWARKLVCTCVYLVQEIRGEKLVGLAIKARKIGAGLFNGYGGALEAGQTLREGAVSEVFDECGVVIDKNTLRYAGVVTFYNTKSDGSIAPVTVHFFLADNWSGEPKESEEMGPIHWFPLDKLPFEKMMSADRQFVPLMLASKKVEGSAHYGPGGQQDLIGKVEVRELDPSTDVDYPGRKRSFRPGLSFI